MRRALAFFCSVAAAVIGSASGCPSHAPLGVASAGPSGGDGTGGAGTGGTGAGGGTGGSAEYSCEQACSDLYNCGLEKTGDAQLCAGFKGGDEEQTFLNGSDNNGCIANCEGQPALKALVNKDDCGSTVSTLKGLNATFKDTCDNGLSGGAGAGGGGTGGAAGVGGAGGSGGGV